VGRPYCLLDLLFRERQDNGSGCLAVNVRPALGIPLKLSVIRVCQDGNVRAHAGSQATEMVENVAWHGVVSCCVQGES
jgi:hypothetical protein